MRACVCASSPLSPVPQCAGVNTVRAGALCSTLAPVCTAVCQIHALGTCKSCSHIRPKEPHPTD
eukprot:799589-Pleurochrysis_carterae.AAC.2